MYVVCRSKHILNAIFIFKDFKYVFLVISRKGKFSRKWSQISIWRELPPNKKYNKLVQKMVLYSEITFTKQHLSLYMWNILFHVYVLWYSFQQQMTASEIVFKLNSIKSFGYLWKLWLYYLFHSKTIILSVLSNLTNRSKKLAYPLLKLWWRWGHSN